MSELQTKYQKLAAEYAKVCICSSIINLPYPFYDSQPAPELVPEFWVPLDSGCEGEPH